MNTFLLVANSADAVSGGRIPADVIVGRRLAAGQWPLYKNTPHQKEMQSGDKAIIYLAGPKQMKFVAQVQIDAITSAKNFSADGDDALTDAPVQAILFSKVQWFKEPISIRGIMANLDFVPKNTIKWGCVLQRGAKKISLSDAEVILTKALQQLAKVS